MMFLIGAPLGAIIKKGGLGMPVIISIFFFIIFYVLTILGEKWGREGLVIVPAGMWAANFILLPIGLFFLYQARNDSNLLEFDFLKRFSKRLKKNNL
jgi:lipopolysaccharide export system permease protein